MAAKAPSRSKATGAMRALDMLRPESVGTAAQQGPRGTAPGFATSIAGSTGQVKAAATKPNPVAAPQSLEGAYGRPGQEATMQDRAQQGQEVQGAMVGSQARPIRRPPIAEPNVRGEAGQASGVSADYIGQAGSVEPMDRRTATVQYGEPGHEFMGGYQRWRQLLGR